MKPYGRNKVTLKNIDIDQIMDELYIPYEDHHYLEIYAVPDDKMVPLELIILPDYVQIS